MPKRGRSMRRGSRSVSSSRARSSSSMTTTNLGASSVAFKRPAAGASFKGRTVKALMSYVKQNLPAPEKKYNLSTITINNATPAGLGNIAPVLLNAMARGDTVQQRTADVISLGKGKFKGQLDATNGASTCRIMIVLDKRPNATALTNAVLFGTNTPAAWQFLDFNNTDVYSRFTVLAEKTYDLTDIVGNSLVATSNQSTTAVDIGWDCNHYTASYKKGNVGTIADIDDGAIYLCMQQSGTMGSGGGGAVGLNGNLVQYFTDL